MDVPSPNTSLGLYYIVSLLSSHVEVIAAKGMVGCPGHSRENRNHYFVGMYTRGDSDSPHESNGYNDEYYFVNCRPYSSLAHDLRRSSGLARSIEAI